MRTILFSILGILFPLSVIAQNPPLNFFNEVRLNIENNTFTTTRDTLKIANKKHLRFDYENIRAVAEVEITPNPFTPIRKLELLPSSDFEVVDSIVNVNNSRYRFKVRFKQLTLSKYLQFTFRIESNLMIDPYIQELKLLQTTYSVAYLAPKDNRLFLGEERTFKVETNRPNNLIISGEWTRGKNINYKFSKEQGEIKLHVLPTRAGVQSLSIPLKVQVPAYDKNKKQLNYKLSPLQFSFDVKRSKLIFLNSNQKEITLTDANKKEGIEIEMEYHPALQLNKTYRLEKQEEAGGYLIAEIYTRSALANGRVLCWLRVFNFHRHSEGYLYMKDGDEAKFFTNFNISPKTQISNVRIIGKKGNFSKGNTLFPGETVEVRMRGIGLHKGKFTFESLIEIPTDSLVQTESEMRFLLHVPMNMNESEIEIFNFGRPSGKILKVQEFQVAHPLNFVKINIGDDKTVTLSEANQVIFYNKTIPNIIIDFNENEIDTKSRIFGKQYLNLEFVISDKNNRLLDRQSVKNVIICPGETSPRFNFYDSKNCRKEEVSLNQYLRQKTFDLEGWSRIEIIVQHDRSKYGGQGFYKKAEIILRQDYSFDLDVSFPAGLVVKKFGEDGFGTLSGVSMAIIAQFSFYHPNRINKTRPYKFGAGFLAFNAFNFSENADNRDVGVVLLASLYPIRSRDRSRLSFPLFLGGGYFLSESKFFYLLGPGIRLRI